MKPGVQIHQLDEQGWLCVCQLVSLGVLSDHLSLLGRLTLAKPSLELVQVLPRFGAKV